jgi:hypothetical protein
MTLGWILSRRSLVTAALVAGLAAYAWILITSNGAAPKPASAADHLDAPGLTPPGGDVKTDITDLYAFRQGGKSVLVMSVNGLTEAGKQATFASAAPSVRQTRRVRYRFHVDNNGDAEPDVNISVRFGRPNSKGVQTMTVRRNGKVLLTGQTSRFGRIDDNERGSVKAYGGMRDDPFFFDLNGFINILSNEPGKSFIGCMGTRPDAFAGTNVGSIVIELPSRMLTRTGSSQIGVWATTNRGGAQVDRMGRPAIATVFIPNNPFEPSGSEPSQKTFYNESRPVDDQARFRGEVVDTLRVLHGLNDGSGDNPADDEAKVQGLADILLPDILTYDTASSAGFLNGRKLADDVIDAELALVTEGAVTTDCVPANDKQFRTAFPYLAGPHS